MDKLWILCLFVSKKNIIIHIREQDYSHYSNSFPKKISFQKQKPIRFTEKRLIRFHELLARVYSTETRK